MKMTIPKFSKAVAAFGDWTLYELPEDVTESILWIKFRLQLPLGTPIRRGANRSYRLVWNPLELRFARSWSRLLLADDRPDLCREVELYLSLNYNRDWLLSPQGAGASARDIEIELARLQKVKVEAARRRSARRVI